MLLLLLLRVGVPFVGVGVLVGPRTVRKDIRDDCCLVRGLLTAFRPDLAPACCGAVDSIVGFENDSVLDVDPGAAWAGQII